MDIMEGFAGTIPGNFSLPKAMQELSRTYSYLEQKAEIADFNFSLHMKCRHNDLFQHIHCHQDWKFSMQCLEFSKGKIVPPRLYYILQLRQASPCLLAVAGLRISYSSHFPLHVGISPQVLTPQEHSPETDHLKDLVICE